MSYETCEDALATVLESVSGFSDRVSKGDHSIIDLGYDQCIVLRYLDFAQEIIGGYGDFNITWGIEIAVFTLYVDDTTVHELARTNRSNIIRALNTHPQLNNTAGVVVSFLQSGSSGGSPPGGPLSNLDFGNASYYHETMRIEITENIDQADAE